MNRLSYKFKMGEIVAHKTYGGVYGEVIERGSEPGMNPWSNYYIIKCDKGFAYRYAEDVLCVNTTTKRMDKLKEIGI